MVTHTQSKVYIIKYVFSEHTVSAIAWNGTSKAQQIVYLVVHNLSYECINPAAYPMDNQGHNLHTK
jgi:hypothetical protein